MGNILAWLIVGGIAGWLVGKVVKGSGYGIVGDIIVGVIGGLIGGWIAGLFGGGFDPSVAFSSLGSLITQIIIAFIGGAILMFIVGAVMGRGKPTPSEMTKNTSDMAKSTTDTMKSTSSSATSMTKDAAAGATGAAGAASASTMAAAGAAGAATMAAAGGAASMTKDAASSVTGMGAMNMDQMMGALNDVMSGKPMDANSSLGKMITPMADGITAKLGLPKGVGAMVVSFALLKIGELMKAKMGTGPMPTGMPAGTTPDQVLGKISSGQGMDAASLQSMGLTSELAKKTGIPESQASQGLEMAMGALSAGMSGQKSYQGMPLPDMSMLTGMMKA